MNFFPILALLVFESGNIYSHFLFFFFKSDIFGFLDPFSFSLFLHSDGTGN
jgi:hypothetical protein